LHAHAHVHCDGFIHQLTAPADIVASSTANLSRQYKG
jgi:hypothetical protein